MNHAPFTPEEALEKVDIDDLSLKEGP